MSLMTSMLGYTTAVGVALMREVRGDTQPTARSNGHLLIIILIVSYIILHTRGGTLVQVLCKPTRFFDSLYNLIDQDANQNDGKCL